MRRQSPLGLFSSQISHSLFSNKHEIVFDQSGAQFDAELLRLVLVFDCLNIDDQRVFHTEYRICGFIGIVLEVQSTVSFSQLSCFATWVQKDTHVINGSNLFFLNMKCMWLGR